MIINFHIFDRLWVVERVFGEDEKHLYIRVFHTIILDFFEGRDVAQRILFHIFCLLNSLYIYQQYVHNYCISHHFSQLNDCGSFLDAMISFPGHVHAPHPNCFILFAGSSIMLNKLYL